MSQSLELHDSFLKELIRRDGGVLVVLDGYLHRSPGRPGVDAGTGWSATLHLWIEDGRVTSEPAALPFEIYTGSLGSTDGAGGDIPVPLELKDGLRFEARGFYGQRLVIEGDGGRLWVEGEPTYVEEVPGFSPG